VFCRRDTAAAEDTRVRWITGQQPIALDGGFNSFRRPLSPIVRTWDGIGIFDVVQCEFDDIALTSSIPKVRTKGRSPRMRRVTVRESGRGECEPRHHAESLRARGLVRIGEDAAQRVEISHCHARLYCAPRLTIASTIGVIVTGAMACTERLPSPNRTTRQFGHSAN
jgi:hypothetical protein